MNTFFKTSGRSLLHFFKSYAEPPFLAIACISYANSFPFLLTGSTLGLWLRTYGLDYSMIGLFGLLHLPYAFKALWAPFLDQMPLPFLSAKLGQRRSWLFLTQITAIGGILGMVMLNPLEHFPLFMLAGFVMTFSGASQHVLLLAYQREILSSQSWGMGEGISIFTYRLGLLTASAGSLYLATYTDWTVVYGLMGALMSIGLLALFFVKDSHRAPSLPSSKNWKTWLNNAFLGPFKDFTHQYRWPLILAFMLLYRLPEHCLHPFLSLFLLNLDFSYTEIANATKVCGMMATITGGIVGGYAIRLYGYKLILRGGAIGYGLSCLLFLLLGNFRTSVPAFYGIIILEHFFSGFTLASFFAYQLACCNQSFAATQIALLTSFTSLGALFSPLAGLLIEKFGWSPYILFTALSAVPGILCLSYLPFPQQSARSKAEKHTLAP